MPGQAAHIKPEVATSDCGGSSAPGQSACSKPEVEVPLPACEIPEAIADSNWEQRSNEDLRCRLFTEHQTPHNAFSQPVCQCHLHSNAGPSACEHHRQGTQDLGMASFAESRVFTFYVYKSEDGDVLPGL